MQVYPAGFVYVFSALYNLTENGKNLVLGKSFHLTAIINSVSNSDWNILGQYIFLLVYVANLVFVLSLYSSSIKVPVWTWAILALSKRVHSIYVLRMFNDCIAVLFGYIALWLFIRRKWRFGCLCYSFAVSIKMNMLLQAPGILLVLLMGTGIHETIICLSICAGLQLLLGFPFLSTYPLEYISRSFDLGRVFMHKWTVNFKFLSEEIFVSQTISITLLFLTILGASILNEVIWSWIWFDFYFSLKEWCSSGENGFWRWYKSERDHWMIVDWLRVWYMNRTFDVGSPTGRKVAYWVMCSRFDLIYIS